MTDEELKEFIWWLLFKDRPFGDDPNQSTVEYYLKEWKEEKEVKK